MLIIQRILFRHFLLLGVSFIGLVLSGCSKEDTGPLLGLDLFYVNRSSKPITISHFARNDNLIDHRIPKSLTIGSGDTANFYSEKVESGHKNNEINDFNNFIVNNRLYDSAYVSFDNEKYIWFSKGIHNTEIFSTENFEGREVKENQFDFFYVFTEEDYESANDIE